MIGWLYFQIQVLRDLVVELSQIDGVMTNNTPVDSFPSAEGNGVVVVEVNVDPFPRSRKGTYRMCTCQLFTTC